MDLDFAGKLSSSNFKSSLKNRKFYNEINNSGLFDSEFYEKTYDDFSGDALKHYLNKGYLEGKLPSLDFDPDFYLWRNFYALRCC